MLKDEYLTYLRRHKDLLRAITHVDDGAFLEMVEFPPRMKLYIIRRQMMLKYDEKEGRGRQQRMVICCS